jgi:Legionella pneumophila major outer membrane protein precursor
MRTKSIWGAAVLAALVALAPARAFAQGGAVTSFEPGLAGDYSPPAVQLPLPLYSNRPDVGGLFLNGGYVMYQQNNPIKSQEIAQRGFVATDDTVLGTAGSAGTFIGTKNNALDTNQVTGPLSFQPGFNVEGGWRFSDGSALTLGFMWLSRAQYNAVATLAAPNYQYRSDQADTFLTSPVYNFPSDFAGAPQKVAQGGPFSVYGIWNGASAMTEVFWQRTEQIQATYRKPFYETDCYRVSALVGPRFFWIEEKFRWVTTDLTDLGNSAPQYVGIYNNQVDNRMYGVHTGLQQEWYLGRGFAAMLNTEAAMFMDIVREKVDYERGDRGGPENKRARTQWAAVPEVQVTPSIMWYPLEGIQLSVGWDFFAFFNTISSPNPVDFNYSALAPNYVSTFRYFSGFMANIAFVF